MGEAIARHAYPVTVGVLVLLGVGFGLGVLAYDNPMPFGTEGFWLIAELRLNTVLVMAVVASSQAVATVAFQTVVTNRIVTPSIMGFEALYLVVQTAAVYFLGIAGATMLRGTWQFLGQIALMVGLALLLYGVLLSGRYADVQIMLLVGIVIGGGLASVSSFMRRLLTPSEFDVLAARMFGTMSQARPEHLRLAVPICLLVCAWVWWRSRVLNVLALGRGISVNLGVAHRRRQIELLTCVAVLVAVSTALIGPMTFFGFLVATLTYQLVGSPDHRRLLPVAALIGFATLSGAYFVMRNLFYTEGVVSILIELIGGSVFLFVILRKGRL